MPVRSHSSSGRARASRRSVSHLRSRQLSRRSDPHRAQVLRARRSGGRRILRGGAGVRPGGQRAPVDRGAAARRWARVRPRSSATFDAARDRGPLEPLVHRWIRGRDLVALLLILQRMLREAGSVEAFFLAGDDPSQPDVGARARLVFRTRAADKSAARLRSAAAEAARASATSFPGPPPAAPASA